MGEPLGEGSGREIYVYTSYEDFLSANKLKLKDVPIREVGITTIVITEEQKKHMKGGLIELIMAIFNKHPFKDEEPLCIKIPGEKEGKYEAVIADLSKASRTSLKEYVVPVRVYASNP